jgi:hypothetical protein
LCNAEGLSTAGSDQDLIERHEAFVTFHNVKCDSFHQRSQQELLREFNQRAQAHLEESIQVRFSGGNNEDTCMECLKERRKQLGENAEPDAAVVAQMSGNKAFDKQLKNNFAKLIAQRIGIFPGLGQTAGIPKDGAVVIAKSALFNVLGNRVVFLLGRKFHLGLGQFGNLDNLQ